MNDLTDPDDEQILGLPRRLANGEIIRPVSTPIEAEVPEQEVPEQAESLGLPRRNEDEDAAERLGPNDPNLFLEESNDESLDPLQSRDVNTKSLRNLDKAFVCLVAIIFGLSLLFLASQSLSVWGQLQSLPSVVREGACFGLIVISVAIVTSMSYLIWQLWRLRETPRVSLAALNQLHERSSTRQSVVHHYSNASQRLEEFVREFPLTPNDVPRLRKLGFDAEIEKLQKSRSRLGDEARGGHDLFIRDVRDHFLFHIDEVAKRRIDKFSNQVAFATAAAPNGFLDGAIVIIHSYMLIGDLCRIYNVRTTPGATVVILAMSVSNMIAASNMGEIAANTSTVVFKSLGGIPIVGGILVGLTGRAAEGTANCLLLRRLGYATLKQLRPIQLS